MAFGGTAKRAVLALLIAGLGASAGGAAESPLDFFLKQADGPHIHRARSRHPLFRPQRERGTAQRRPATSGEAASAAPIRPAVAAPPRPAAPQPPATPADFAVAVFGDGAAADLARGLAASRFGTRTAVTDATGERTGLGNEPAGTWSAALDAAARSRPVDAAVVMLDPDDPRPFPDGQGGLAEPGTPAWREACGRRVEAIAALFRDRRVPLVWVGLPPVRDAAGSARRAEFNTIVREHAGLAGASVVGTWGGFADDGGQYVAAGPDVDGRMVRLRRGDGFTAAGARKLASFAGADLRREADRVAIARKLAAIGADDQSLFDQALAIDVNAQIRREAGLPPLRRTAARAKDGPVLSLTASPVADAAKLETADSPLALSADAESVLVSGLVPPSRPGRIDDFSWAGVGGK